MDKGLKHIIKTGTVLDELMDGIEPGIVTTFFGFPGSGKTTLCMQISIRLMQDGKVAYVDTESGFSPVRLKQIHPGDSSNILVFKPRSWSEQRSLTERFREMKPSLIVIDSSVSLFRLEQADSREFARYFRDLTHLAEDLSIPVIATNQAYEWDGKTEMVLRTMSEYWSKAVVYIEKTDRSGVRKLILRKHRWLPEGREVTAELTSDGFRKSKRFGII